MHTLRPRFRRATVLGVASVLSLSACGLLGNNDANVSPSASIAPENQTHISMALWGGFGLDDLISEYETLHPDVVIKLIKGDYNPLHDSLQRELVSGSGAPTIAAIGEDYIAKFASQPDQFVNLSTLGADDYKDVYLPWKWAEGTSPDGSSVIGMGADVSGLALCYRSDLFAAAGLPTDRLAVSGAMRDSWEGFLALGEQYTKASNGAAFIDNATTLLEPIRDQTGASFYYRERRAQRSSRQARLRCRHQGDRRGAVCGHHPVLRCLGQGPERRNVCGHAVPRVGHGLHPERGDSLQLQAQVGHRRHSWSRGLLGRVVLRDARAGHARAAEAAWDFLNWLLQPDQQLRIFQATGSLPSQPALYTDDSVKSYEIPFFNDAPVGPILAKSVEELPVKTDQNPNNGNVEAALQEVLAGVQSGNVRAPMRGRWPRRPPRWSTLEYEHAAGASPKP